jgi:hypothetical protein
MASLLAASRQDLAATYGLHARAKSVRFGAAALARLICALWQSNPPIELRVAPGKSFSAKPKRQLTYRFRGCLRNNKCTCPTLARSRKLVRRLKTARIYCCRGMALLLCAKALRRYLYP